MGQRGDFRRRLDQFVQHPDDCWPWYGSTSRDGYGKTSVRLDGRRRSVLAHVLAYELLVGPVPDGKQIDHLCRNRPCINPRHLEPVSQQENVLRGEGPAAQQARRTTCSRGHPLVSDPHAQRLGRRYCPICYRAYFAAYNARRRAR